MTMTPVAGQRRSLKDLKVGRNAQPQWPDKIKFADMADNPDNPRESLRNLEGLAATIKESGILQDLVLVPRENWLQAHPEHDKSIQEGGIGDKPFVILIGHRRRHAGELAGLDEGPVKVREDVAVSSRRNALIENIQRDDLSPLEEAHAIRDLMQEEGISQRETATILGKTPAWVSQRLALLGLIPELQQALARGELRIEDARKIGKLPHEEQAMPAPIEAVPSPPPAFSAAHRPSPSPEPTRDPQREALQRGSPGSAAKPRSRVDGDHLDEALRVEGAVIQAATQAGNLRVLRRIAHEQPAVGKRILDHMEETITKLTLAAKKLRSDLESPTGG